MISEGEIDVIALKHTVNVIRAAMSPDPEESLQSAYLTLSLQKLNRQEMSRVRDITLGDVLAILREIVPEGPMRERLLSNLGAVDSYADLLEVMNGVSRPLNRAERRKQKGGRR